MDEVQSGLKTLAENLPGFQSFVDAMNGNTQSATTEATTTEVKGLNFYLKISNNNKENFTSSQRSYKFVKKCIFFI